MPNMDLLWKVEDQATRLAEMTPRFGKFRSGGCRAAM